MENTLVGRRCHIAGQGETEFVIKALDYTIEEADYNSKHFCVSGVLVEKQVQVQEGLRIRTCGYLSHHTIKELILI